MEYLAQHVESLIFTSENPISFGDLKHCLEEAFEQHFQDEVINDAINELTERYQQEHHAFELIALAGGYQFLTKGAYHHTVGTYLRQTTKKRLSRAALETLAIIAYKQPTTKTELEKIRGVSCDYSIQKLLEKELVTIVGRSEKPGRPLLYGTSERFLNYFGIQSLAELPKPKDFRIPDNEIGEAAPVEEMIAVDEPTSAGNVAKSEEEE
ncbi:MAG: SMC-Scp complex subunit ScpB [Bacteroidota bacterium]